jgi:hypothetical protein
MPRISFNLPEYRRKHSNQSASSFRPKESIPGWKQNYDQKPTRKSKKPVPEDKQDRVYTGPLNKLVTYAISSIHGQGVSFKEKPGQSKFDAGVQALMKSIKKIDRRIAAAKKSKDEFKRMKLEALKTRQMHLLQEANSVKQHLDARSLNRMRNEQAIASGELIRIGKRDEKLVPRKRPKGMSRPVEVEYKPTTVGKSLERVSSNGVATKGIEATEQNNKTTKTVKSSAKGGASPWTAEEKMALDEEFRRMLGE